MTDQLDQLQDDDVRAMLSDLARPHRSGGVVIERAAVLAAGTDSTAMIAWILAHDGHAEEEPAARATGGLHGGRADSANAPRHPRRYVLPADAL